MQIEVIEFVRPHGRQKPITLEASDELAPMVEKIKAKGYRFEAELLRPENSTKAIVSLTVSDLNQDFDIELIEIEAGAGLTQLQEGTDRLIRRAANRL